MESGGSPNYRFYSHHYELGPYIANRHNGGANFGFCDGHAKWYKVAHPNQGNSYEIGDIRFYP